MAIKAAAFGAGLWCAVGSISAQYSSDLTQQASHFFDAKDFLQASEKLEEYRAQHPHSRSTYLNLQQCYYQLGDKNRLCSLASEAEDNGVHFVSGRSAYLCNTAFRVKFQTNIYYPKTDVYFERGYRPEYTRADSLRGALRPERTCYDVNYYDLSVELFPRSRTIAGSNTFYFTALSASRTLQLDLFEPFRIERIVMGDTTLSFHREYQAVFVDLPKTLVPGNRYRLTVYYEGKPQKARRPPWQGGFVWSHDSRLHRWTGVACEQLGASSWWPVKDHLSDRPDSMSIRITVPHRYHAVSNGRLRSVDTLPDGKARFNWFVSYPINSYNATFYMGRYVSFMDTIPLEGQPLEAWYHVLPWNRKRAEEYFKQAREVVAFYSKTFGMFPFRNDRFRMVESPYEGMEHQTAIAYGNAYNVRKNSVGYLNRQYDYIIVHEAAHEWWGNSVTVGDMADVWLHEGFATYSEYLFLEDKLGYEAAMEEMAHQWPLINNIWPLVQNRNVNEDAFVGQDVYLKGAQLLQSLRACIDNDSLFLGMLRGFYNQFRYQVIQSDDFVRFVNAYTGQDFTPLFNLYLYKTQPPTLMYTYRKEGDSIRFSYWWSDVDEGFTLPFSIEVLGPGTALRLVGTTQKQEVVLEGAQSFRFFNGKNGVANCPHNGLTYYFTSLSAE